MSIFLVYQKIRQKNKFPPEIKIIRSGFSIYPAIFNIWWALYNNMLIIAIPFFLIYIGLYMFDLSYFLAFYELCLFLIFAFFSEELMILNAKISGFELVDIIYESTDEDAEYQYLQKANANKD
ncbi:MAG: hypothetical protein SFT93_03220 [Rickettsiaceae bacterium]|nr:hypothetical protein [Rickettsiaceae bacterium]